MIDFEGAFCVVYDIAAREITLTHAEGEGVREITPAMAALLRAPQHPP